MASPKPATKVQVSIPVAIVKKLRKSAGKKSLDSEVVRIIKESMAVEEKINRWNNGKKKAVR